MASVKAKLCLFTTCRQGPQSRSGLLGRRVKYIAETWDSNLVAVLTELTFKLEKFKKDGKNEMGWECGAYG